MIRIEGMAVVAASPYVVAGATKNRWIRKIRHKRVGRVCPLLETATASRASNNNIYIFGIA